MGACLYASCPLFNVRSEDVKSITVNAGSYSLCAYNLWVMCSEREPEVASLYFLHYVTPCRLSEMFRPLEQTLLPPSSGYKIRQTKQQAVCTRNKGSIGRGGLHWKRGLHQDEAMHTARELGLLSVSLQYTDSLYFICQISSLLALDFAVSKNPSKSEALCNIP
jgi:hypothetical protein